MHDFKNALKIDFTGCLTGFESFRGFNDDVCEIIRKQPGKTLIVVDYAIKMQTSQPACVSDHINLSGSNPLIGPNHPCGERFPVMNDIYVTNSLPAVITAGLKPGFVPTEDEFDLINTWGVSAVCYNLVPTAIIAGHAGYKILGLLTPEDNESISRLSAYMVNSLAK